MSVTSSNFFKEFDLDRVQPPVLYRKESQMDDNPYSHYMRRAFESMKLDGIFCIEKKPTIYFKEVKQINSKEAQEFHKLLWNQGIATLLVLVSPKEIHIYSGLSLPDNREIRIGQSDNRLVQVIERTAEILELREFIQSVETGKYYQDRSDYFHSENAVDQFLLKNLGNTRDKLIGRFAGKIDSKQKYKISHALLGRIIFTCYLVDREIINGHHFSGAGADGVHTLQELVNNNPPDKVRKILYRLFKNLQTIFNGSMFDDTLSDEYSEINVDHIHILRDFLNGEEIQTGQQTFWAYDFSVIPIETISAMYENFLKAESEEAQSDSGAFYTPKHLAEMVVDVAVDDWDTLLGKRILDPACGSGIFLVILFNRIAEEWRRNHRKVRNSTRVKKLTEIIQTQLCGIDKHQTACRITCFSLYLALLDQLEPRDIRELQQKHQKVLPNLLALEENNWKTHDPPVIYEGNFFDTKIPVPNDFDLVIGNPPWISRGRATDPKPLEWCLSKANPFLETAPINKQTRTSYFMPAKQIAHAFMWKSPLHANPSGKICQLLPSKTFLNRTDTFQEGWFSNFTVDKVIHLADYRRILFEHSICPAVITKYTPLKPDSEKYYFSYDVPKVHHYDPRRGVIYVLPEDQKEISVHELITSSRKKEAPIVWKKRLWGTLRDNRLINRLLSLPRLGEIVGTPEEPKRFICGQGFIKFNQEKYAENPKGYGVPKPAWWKKEQIFINARSKNINLVLLEEDCEEVGGAFKFLYRNPDKRIFQPPMILVNQGFSKIAYVDFDVLFQDSLQSICAPEADKNLLLFLSVVLNSKLATYFFFHTAANWGSERDKVHFFEVKNFPYPLPENHLDPPKANSIINKVSEQIQDLIDQIKSDEFLKRDERKAMIESIKKRLEPLVYEYYNIADCEKDLIEDTVNVYEPSSTPTTTKTQIPTLSPTDPEQRKKYVRLICDLLNQWGKRSPYQISGIVTLSESIGLGIVTLYKQEQSIPYSESKSSKILQQTLDRIQKQLPEQKGRIAYRRGLMMFEENQLHIVKPLNVRHWTQTAALNDADEIATAILMAKR